MLEREGGSDRRVAEEDMTALTPEALKELVDGLCKGSDRQIDASCKPRLQALLTTPMPARRIKLLEILDDCVYASLSSDFVVRVLNILYEDMGGNLAMMDTDRKDPTYDSMAKKAGY